MPKQSKNNFLRILKFIIPHQGIFIFTVISTLLIAIISPIRPLIIGFMVDKYVMGNESYKGISSTLNSISETNFSAENGFLYWAIIAIITIVIEAVFRFVIVYLSNLIGQKIIQDIREKLFNHFIRFKTQYFDKNPIGRIVTRLVSDIEATSEIFSNGIISISGDLISLSLVVILMFAENWKFTLMILIPIPLLFWATKIFKNAIKKAYQKESSQVSKLNTFVQERIVGMNILQLFSREDIEYKNFTKINKEHRNAHVKSIWAYSIFFPAVEILSSVSIAFVIFYASYQIIDRPIEEASAGQLIAFILWVNMLFRPIRQLADKFNVIQRGLVRAGHIFEVLDDEQTITSRNKQGSEDSFSGNITFKNVSFAYNTPDYVLKNISLEIKEGETVAFVGATGAGKSSIINILSRFYEYQEGEILINGTDLRSFPLETIRKNIVIVLQDVFLFSDTIFNNITLKNKNITKEQVIKASKEIGLHDFIMKLSNNYDFNVKERGVALSTGQRQLVSFIRAYIYSPKILVLDEATSNIDTETEELIQQSIDKLTQNRTSIIVAHRLSTIKKADKIIVLDQGKIVEFGTHKELLAKNGFYKNLHTIQFDTH